MRLAWFTPASGESAVVEYSRHVLAALRTFTDPVLFSDGPAEHFAEGLATVDFGAEPEALAKLGGYDAVFYNLGNHVDYHAAIWEVATCRPGIVVLHDRVLHHFFLEYFAGRMRAPERYRARMGTLYGSRGEAVAERILEGRRRGVVEEELFAEHSFIEDAVRGARGVVVHSHWHGQAVRAKWNGPLAELWLPSSGHSPHAYARELTAFAEQVGAWTPRLAIADRVGRELAALGADPRMAGVKRVTRETVSLFGSPRT